MDFNRSGYISRNEFSIKAKYEIERILSQPNYRHHIRGYGYGPHIVSPSVSPSNYYLPSPGYAPNVPQGVPHRDMDMMLPHHIGDYIELISVILIIY